jgi:site-specific recombinase XerD
MNTCPPNEDKKLPPTYLQPGDVEALLDACDQTQHPVRNRALVTFLYRTGAVIGEALSVRLPDIDLTDNTVRLTGEKLADRTVGIDQPLHQALSEWLQERATLDLEGDWVFCRLSKKTGAAGQPGDALSYERVQWLWKVLTKAAGLGTRVHAQAFRHSFAVELIGEGWPLPYIQRQLGITVFRNLDTFMKNLDMRLPNEDEVVAVIHTRVWDSS